MQEKERVDSRNIISDYIFYSKYSRTKPDGTKESWEESVSRVMQMHWQFFEGKIKEEDQSEFNRYFQKAWSAYDKKQILGSQRALQYGGPQMLKNHLRLYNCSASYANRIEFFPELMELLLSGAGVGYSVQKKHTEQLPKVIGIDKGRKQIYEIEDSIEGWATSTGDLIKQYFNNGPQLLFDYSKIRPEGAYVSGGFKAPGPEPLMKCHEKIRAILDKVQNRKLRPFEIHWIACIIADAVISGGIRRSAMISLFDIDDQEMLMCKTKDWYNYWPELCRCNNSAVILPDTPKEKYLNLFSMIKEYGEPGVIFLKNPKQIMNPCCFSGDTLIGVADGRNAVSIKRLAEEKTSFPIYYKNNRDKVCITKGIAFCTGEKELIEVILSNGSSFKCTKDHPLRLKNGEYKIAENCIGETLSKFYSVKSVKYRTINSISNGYARQYRMLWEFTNGPKPEGFEIDHIDDNKGDFIENLELLPREEHLLKTSKRRKGENNPNQIIKLTEEERNRRSYNASVKGTLEGNGRYLGLTNKELIEIGKKVYSATGSCSNEMCRKFDERFPLNFSKNRFQGSRALFKAYVTEEIEYKEEVDNRTVIEKPKNDFSSYLEDVYVVDIINLNLIEEVYDIEVETPEHNFAIITKGEGNYMFSEGIFVHNCEVGMLPEYKNEDGSIEYGFGFCNLAEINGAKIKSEADFYNACEAAAILGTFQAAYTKNFPVLSETSKKLAERDALIGVGITGMADCPQILFDPNVQRKGAQIVKETNEKIAKILGINSAARTTVIKPSGNASQLLGCASGVHAYHFRKYIRNIQANNNEQAFQEMRKINPQIISTSYWNPKNESVLSFPIELPEDALVRTEYSTIEFLERIRLTKENWIEEGTRFDHPSTLAHPDIRMNVSCTVSVKDNEWEEVAEYIWKYRESFCGISFLNETAPNSYPQMPYTQYLDEKELVEQYGRGAILSSGLIVDGLNVFNDIWTACNAALHPNDKLLTYSEDYLFDYLRKHMKDNKLLVEIDGLFVSDVNAISSHLQHKVELRNDWVRRFKKFAHNYFNDDLIQCAECLKQVDIFHKWHKIKYQTPIDWTKVKWETVLQDAGSQVGAACSGNGCELR